MTKKLGRPPLPAGKRKVHFTIRFTKDQLAAFEKAAKRVNQKLGEWVTAVLTNAAN